MMVKIKISKKKKKKKKKKKLPPGRTGREQNSRERERDYDIALLCCSLNYDISFPTVSTITFWSLKIPRFQIRKIWKIRKLWTEVLYYYLKRREKKTKKCFGLP